jgi:hypothetical protein
MNKPGRRQKVFETLINAGSKLAGAELLLKPLLLGENRL